MFTPKNPGIPFQLISNVVNFKPPRVQMLLVFFQDHLTFLKHDLIFFFVFTCMCQNLYQYFEPDKVKQ